MSKGDVCPEGSMWSGMKDGRLIYYAEISYQGKRWKHNGTPNRETIVKWLEGKKEYIQKLIEGKLEVLKEMASHPVDVSKERLINIRTKRYSGSIYETTYSKRGKKSNRYCAEINCKGYRIRKHSVDRAKLEEWLNEKIRRINEISDDTEILLQDNYRHYVTEERRILAQETISILEYLREDSNKVDDKLTLIRKNNDKLYDGFYTYVLIDNSTGFFKIGKTKNLKQRLAAFCNPNYSFVMVRKGDIEKKLHQVFMKQRLLGEWFKLCEDDLSFLGKEYYFIDFQ